MSVQAVLRFGPFELDSKAAELRQAGDVVKLAPQPLKVLEMLARQGGEVVTRTQLLEHVWAGDTFVDFEQGLNFCIRQIREALGDSAHAPRYIETLPRRGYRFLMPVAKAAPGQPASAKRLIVLPFRMLRPDPDTEFLTFSLPDALSGSLSGLDSLVVRSSMVAARFTAGAEGFVDLKKVAAEADVDLIVTGTLLRSGDDVRVSAQMTDVVTGTLMWSGSAQARACDVFAVQDDLAQRIVSSLLMPFSVRDERSKRDVPANAAAYEFFLRGNQLSHDPKQYAVARDLYLRAIDEDPQFAPAWARLGRIHHVMAKYIETGQRDGFNLAEQAFRRALDLNPDLTMAHKVYAQLEVDLGRARDAMARLLERAKTADPELLAGLVPTCRYCGLLDASVAAHTRAVALEPRIKTSVPHTWFLQGDHPRVAAVKLGEYPYIVALSMHAEGRGAEAALALRDLEQSAKSRVPAGFIAAARNLLEGNKAESVVAINRTVASGFSDPEALFYAGRHLAHLGETDGAFALLERVVKGGFFCYPALAADPWLAGLRKKPAFTKVLKQAETQHKDAADAFANLGGAKLLGSK